MTNGLTENGKCFTPEELERRRKAKDKEVINGVKGMKVKKSISKEEAGEFLKLIKHNEYNCGRKTEENPCQDIPDVYYPKFWAPPQCPAKGFEWKEEDVEEFTMLVKKLELVRELTKEELETINISKGRIKES